MNPEQQLKVRKGGRPKGSKNKTTVTNDKLTQQQLSEIEPAYKVMCPEMQKQIDTISLMVYNKLRAN